MYRTARICCGDRASYHHFTTRPLSQTVFRGSVYNSSRRAGAGRRANYVNIELIYANIALHVHFAPLTADTHLIPLITFV